MLDKLGRTAFLAKAAVGNYLTKKPLCISFEITHCCNAKCQHCHRGGSFKEARATPEKLGMLSRDLNPPVAQISGGEPLLRKDVLDIVRAVRRPDGGPYLVFVTNGALLTKKKYHELLEAGVDQFSVSLDYPDERHDEFRAIPGLFNKLRDLCAELKKDGDHKINFNSVVQSKNYRDLMGLAEVARDWGAHINYSPYTWMRTEDRELVLTEEQNREYREIIGQLMAFKKEHGVIRTAEHFMYDIADFFDKGEMADCRAGERFLVVNPDGTLSPCGLIMTKHETLEDLRAGFVEDNTCVACNTCIRASTEKPLNNMVRGGLVDVLVR